jgi:hypothetical protein
MMEIILFTAVAIAIYLSADWVLRWAEERRGAAFKQRQVIFFAVFLVLALTSFELLKRIL